MQQRSRGPRSSGYPVSTKAEGLTWKYHSWRRQQVNLLPSSPQIFRSSLPVSLPLFLSARRTFREAKLKHSSKIKRAQHQLLISSASVIAAGGWQEPLNIIFNPEKTHL
ncbi:hypothetical protein OIU74_023517 [Salix koriyanagi]|uniref:Uncharacterized protein n=1 Tax=Salix koriyanagi TaxID=2511006 RepID=A0A9Q0WCU9_9ROSI|nr:hypothetical protein OIU74_023517 [Salix koriyanagi]